MQRVFILLLVLFGLGSAAWVIRALVTGRRTGSIRATVVTASGEPAAPEALLTDVDASVTPERR